MGNLGNLKLLRNLVGGINCQIGEMNDEDWYHYLLLAKFSIAAISTLFPSLYAVFSEG